MSQHFFQGFSARRGAALLGAVGLALLGLPASCTHSDDAASHSAQGGSAGSDFPSSFGQGGSNLGADGVRFSAEELSGPGLDATGLGRSGFRFGINLGHPNAAFGDDQMADLAEQVGVTSIRLKYPEYHFARWGQDIEVSDAKHYASLGMKNHVAFVIGMTEQHSTAPADSADWERDYYIPKNLYEPIFGDDGAINPDNYYAQYLADTFSTYKQYVSYWEIFNEPDWVSDWSVTQNWDSTAPSADELVRFHGSIFDYVRMLRIASTVRDKVAPGTYIMTGGLGYPSFLSAILRYTDNPDGGAVSDAYPETGGAYFDIVSFHHYPHLTESGPSDAALDSFIEHRDAFQTALELADVKKGFMVTESGAAHLAIAETASGPDYARNYLQKAMVWAKAEGLLGVDWFTLSDASDTSDAFASMGLYSNLASISAPAQAQQTTTAKAYITVSYLLRDARFDSTATAALKLPSGARGYAFSTGVAQVYALWASTASTEAGQASVTLPGSPASIEVWEWDAGATGPSHSISDSSEVELIASPRFFVVR